MRGRGPPAVHGTPDEVAGDIERHREVGVDRFVLSFGGGSADDLTARLRRFAETLRPAVGG